MPTPSFKEGEPSSPSPGKGDTKGKKNDPSIAGTASGVPRTSPAVLAVGLSVSTAAIVAVPVTSSAATTSSAPTASISMWMETNGTPLDNYWVAQAKAFDKANPGDTINIEFPAASVYNSKVAAALAGNNPPALSFGWGHAAGNFLISMPRWWRLTATQARATPAARPGRATSSRPASGP